MSEEKTSFEVNRRSAIKAIVGTAATGLSFGLREATAAPARPSHAYVGCRTTRERNARGDGIVVYRIPTREGGSWEKIQTLTGLLNPSYLTLNSTGTRLYTVHGDSSEISSFKIDREAKKIELLNTVSCNGKNPVHIALTRSGRHIVVANHLTVEKYVSNVAVIAVAQDGSLGEITDLMELKGKPGPHRVEQPFAKPHQIVFDPSSAFMIVPDKGLDMVHSLRLDDAGKLSRAVEKPVSSREGDGPRHTVFHPTEPFVYVLDELSSTIISCRYDAKTGVLTPVQYISSLPDTFIGFSRGSEIDISHDGRHVYASNRGHDSIGTFAVDAGTGRLTAVAWTPCGGKTPRFFAMGPDGHSIYVANEDTDTIIEMKIAGTTGVPAKGVVVAETGSPTSIVFI